MPERLPTTTQLLANYPNPFNPETWIPFQLSQEAEVRLTIYDVAGKTVRKMELGHLTAGSYSRTEKEILRHCLQISTHIAHIEGQSTCNRLFFEGILGIP